MGKGIKVLEGNKEMRIKWGKEAKAIYIYINDLPVAKTQELEEEHGNQNRQQ